MRNDAERRFERKAKETSVLKRKVKMIIYRYNGEYGFLDVLIFQNHLVP